MITHFSFNSSFNCSTGESSFERFEEYETLFKQIPTNLKTIVRKTESIELKLTYFVVYQAHRFNKVSQSCFFLIFLVYYIRQIYSFISILLFFK